MHTAAAAFLILAASVSHAMADETFDAFRSLCVDTHANADAASVAADHANWMTMPQALMDKFNHDAKMQNAQGRMKSTASMMNFLITANGASPARNFTGDFCMIVSLPDAGVSLDQAAQALAGVDADKSASTDGTAYIWHTSDGRHIRVTASDRDFQTLMANGDLNILMVKHDDKMSVIGFVVPTTATAPPDDKQQH